MLFLLSSPSHSHHDHHRTSIGRTISYRGWIVGIDCTDGCEERDIDNIETCTVVGEEFTTGRGEDGEEGRVHWERFGFAPVTGVDDGCRWWNKVLSAVDSVWKEIQLHGDPPTKPPDSSTAFLKIGNDSS